MDPSILNSPNSDTPGRPRCSLIASMRLRESAPFAVGPFDVVLQSDSAELLSRYESLFSGFAHSSGAGTPVVVKVEHRDDGFAASFDGTQVCVERDAGAMELCVTRVMNRRVLDAEAHVLHLHAGAVTRAGLTVLIIGSSMSGKSTLVAKLVSLGWSYLSDEQLGVMVTGALVPYPRSITLRQESWPLFDHLVSPAMRTHAHGGRLEVPPSQFGSTYHGAPVCPTIAVCPDVSTTTQSTEHMKTSETMSMLLEQSLDLERAGRQGLETMLAVVTAAPGYHVRGQDLAETCAAIEELSATASAPGQVRRSDVVDEGERSERRAGSQAWMFADDSAALYEPESGMLARLDEAGYEAWIGLGRSPTASGPQQFVRELRDAGLLVDSTDR